MNLGIIIPRLICALVRTRAESSIYGHTRGPVVGLDFVQRYKFVVPVAIHQGNFCLKSMGWVTEKLDYCDPRSNN